MVRRLNGIAAAVLLAFFLVHALLGVLEGRMALSKDLVGLVWAGVALALLHIALSVAASFDMLRDEERPPSSGKKRHLVWKWASGALLFSAGVFHCQISLGSLGDVLAACALLALLCAHGWVGARSLLKDLSLDKSLKTVFRVCLCILIALLIAGTVFYWS